MVENDNSAPVIHNTTRVRRDGIKSPPPPLPARREREGAQERRTCLRHDLTKNSYSASGWFSGRALSNAGNFAHAASTARIFGNWSSGTLKRRALATCGTMQRSASVTALPNAYGPGSIIASTASKPVMIQSAYQASMAV